MSAQLYGVDMFGESAAPKPAGPVAERFLFPPFTVLDARSGDWQERKRAWASLGMKSEEGRDKGMTYGAGLGIKLASGEESQTSIFDPALCEAAYRWFCAGGGAGCRSFRGRQRSRDCSRAAWPELLGLRPSRRASRGEPRASRDNLRRPKAAMGLR